jgi:hypothetical protein
MAARRGAHSIGGETDIRLAEVQNGHQANEKNLRNGINTGHGKSPLSKKYL